MGNAESEAVDAGISPKIKHSIKLFGAKMAALDSDKKRRALILECKVSDEFNARFDLNKWVHIARYVLSSDDIVAKQRQKCVPSLLKEREFWSRYFYLVLDDKKKRKKSQRKQNGKSQKAIPSNSESKSKENANDESKEKELLTQRPNDDLKRNKTSKSAKSTKSNKSSKSMKSKKSKKTTKSPKRPKSAEKCESKKGAVSGSHSVSTSTSNPDSNRNANSMSMPKSVSVEEEESFQMLLHKARVHLYRIPGSLWFGRSNRCELWGLRNPLWSGRLRIVAFREGQHLEFQFLENDGKCFLKSTRIKLEELRDDDDDDPNPIHRYFDAYGVVDSSRYFVFWTDVPGQHQTAKRIPFGFGIRDRVDAFDIRAAVADQMKMVRRAQTRGSAEGDGGGMDTDTLTAPHHDEGTFDLRPNEMISIGPHSDSHRGLGQRHSAILEVDEPINMDAVPLDDDSFLLTPPPSPPTTPNGQSQSADDDEVEFGDFQTPMECRSDISENDGLEQHGDNDHDDDDDVVEDENGDNVMGMDQSEMVMESEKLEKSEMMKNEENQRNGTVDDDDDRHLESEKEMDVRTENEKERASVTVNDDETVFNPTDEM